MPLPFRRGRRLPWPGERCWAHPAPAFLISAALCSRALSRRRPVYFPFRLATLSWARKPFSFVPLGVFARKPFSRSEMCPRRVLFVLRRPLAHRTGLLAVATCRLSLPAGTTPLRNVPSAMKCSCRLLLVHQTCRIAVLHDALKRWLKGIKGVSLNADIRCCIVA